MRLEEFTAITTQIAQNLSNQALVTELLTKLNDDYNLETTAKDNLTKQVGEFEGQIKSLQQTNMNLFLKVANPTPTQVLNNTEVEKKMSYDDLLNEWDKGEK